jgi:hypothetical protein
MPPLERRRGRFSWCPARWEHLRQREWYARSRRSCGHRRRVPGEGQRTRRRHNRWRHHAGSRRRGFRFCRGNLDDCRPSWEIFLSIGRSFPMTLKTRMVWKIVKVAVIVVALLDFFWCWHVWNVYFDTLPRSPDRAAGRVYVDNFHGIPMYETREEHNRLRALDHSSEALIVIVLLGATFHEWKAGRTKARRK